MGEDKWGAGDRFDSFDTVRVGDAVMELGWGEHPHSRSENNIYVRTAGGSVIGFDGHRVQVKVVVETANYMKESELSGDEVRRECTATIYFNGVVAKTLYGRDPLPMLLAAHRAIPELFEMTFSVWHDGPDLVGRPIYYGHTPAVVQDVLTDSAELFIVPEAGLFPPPPHAMEDGPDGISDWLSDYGEGMRVRDSDPEIWWWRSAPPTDRGADG